MEYTRSDAKANDDSRNQYDSSCDCYSTTERLNVFNIKEWKFPAGELGIHVTNYSQEDEVTLDLKFKSSDDIISLLLKVDALRRLNKEVKISLNMPYVPYARQDRVVNSGEAHSLKVFCSIINSCNFEKVHVVDPHSMVCEALLENMTVKTQADAFFEHKFSMNTYDFLIAPDAGAEKKIFDISKINNIPVVCAKKKRDVSGKIVLSSLQEEDFEKIKGKKCLMIDDICDGGSTFIELAKNLPEDCVVDLYVTHGIFSKGKATLMQFFNEISCYNDMSS
jgi:ribose-phosphate pyrophosphokinase